MKYIFDFDDVLFWNTGKLKPRMYQALAEAGVPETEAREYYLKSRKGFTMRGFVASLLARKNMDPEKAEALYQTIMADSGSFLNEELVRIVEEAGKDNCFLVTNGAVEHQMDKIDRAEIGHLFREITVVPGSKKEAVENICRRFAGETVVFIDDKEEYFKDLDYKNCPNLRTILFTNTALLRDALQGLSPHK